MARRPSGVPQSRLKVFPYFFAFLTLALLLWLIAVGGAGWKWPTPKLGLDLQGGLSMTLSASLPGGATPDAAKMEQARQIIDDRVNGTGVAEPEVVIEGNNNIVVNVAGKDSDPDALRKIGEPAELRFRQVIDQSTDMTVTPEDLTDPSASPSASASDAASDPAADPSESASDAPTDGAAPTATKDEDPPADVEAAREAVKAKVGADLYAQAEALTAAPTDATAMDTYAPFGDLTGNEVYVLPATMQFYVPTIGCDQLASRPAGAVAPTDQQVVACNDPEEEDVKAGTDGYVKYLMDVAKVVGEDVSDAAAGTDPSSPGSWMVTLDFTNSGQSKWTTLTEQALNQQVAIVLDNLVVSAPTIQNVISGPAQITGSFNSTQARLLAEQLKYGSLPVAFTVETIEEVSPTLGISQMEAGLLAGAIGVALVIVYCMIYYRLLGFVVIASLVASAALIYPAISLLGKQIGFTLTLAGITGFIVAIGITADSFVVFFERLKDEVKEGRSMRSAVPRAWVLARRTILSANTVSLLAALVLYFLAIGQVRGFAFTLGLSTLFDTAVVFLFTHPLVAWLSRFKMLASPRLSGLGGSRRGALLPAPGVLRKKES